MAALMVLLASWFVLRGMGVVGIVPLATWQHSAVYALAVMFVFTGTAHFNKMKHDLARMIPSGFPQPLLIVYATGVLEFLGAIGLLVSSIVAAHADAAVLHRAFVVVDKTIEDIGKGGSGRVLWPDHYFIRTGRKLEVYSPFPILFESSGDI